MERVGIQEEDMEQVKRNGEMDEGGKDKILQAKRMKSIADILEDAGVLIDTHFFNEFYETKSSVFLKGIIANQNVIDMTLLKKTQRSLNCTPKTMKVIREIKRISSALGKELITKNRTESKRLCSNTGLALNAKHIVSCRRNVSAEINASHDIVVNVLLNNMLVQRGLIFHE